MKKIITEVYKAKSVHTYRLYASGELWVTLGREPPVLAGHVADPENISEAIDAFEEELHFLTKGLTGGEDE